MIPFGTETVTLYHRSRGTDDRGRTMDTWTRHTLTGCSWRQTRAQTMADGAA